MSPSREGTRTAASLSLNGLSDLAVLGRQQVYAAGATIITQDDESHSMYIILRGRVQVLRHHPAVTEPIILAELGPGETVGEMGVLEHARRSATVIALEETEVVEIDAESLRAVLLRSPDVADALLRTLSRRLRATDEQMDQQAARTRGRGKRQKER